MKPATKEAYKLLHDGSLALADAEANGMRVDEELLHKTIKKTERKIGRIEQRLKDDPLYRRWRKVYGDKAKLGNINQLGHILFDVMGYKAKERTEKTQRAKLDESALESVGLPFVQDYIQMKKLEKVKNTFLLNIAREVCNGFVHFNFNLNTVITYRSSCDTPNLQNIPVRDPMMGELIRSCFIPRKNHVLVEIDFGGAEVRASCAYHKDPALIRYCSDPTTDMHREMASQCYKLKPEQVSKAARYCGKNMFVFPQFYGSYYSDCARNMWEAMDRMSIVVEGTETPIREHLAKKGIKSQGACEKGVDPRPGTFEYHLKEVQDYFWDVRFPVYRDWKRSWFRKYQGCGEARTLTGFTLRGAYRRNDIINYPIQGTAFHWLLWSLIELNKECRKRKLRVKICGQIHDSIIADVHKDDMAEYTALAHEIITVRLRKHWKWINVPVEVEAEASDENWFKKKPIKLAA